MATNPLLWLALSFLLVCMSLTAVLVVLVPTVVELSRAARSIEKLCDILSRELPATLESIRLTTTELTELTDEVATGMQTATRMVRQVDKNVGQVRQQAQHVQVGTRSLLAGARAAWTVLTQKKSRRQRRASKYGPRAQRALARASERSGPGGDHAHQAASNFPKTSVSDSPLIAPPSVDENNPIAPISVSSTPASTDLGPSDPA